MSDKDRELLRIWEKYGGDARQILRENKRLDCLHAFSVLRENLLDWYEFPKDAAVLQIGGDAGALTGLLAERTARVDIYETDPDAMALVRGRVEGTEGVICLANAPSAQYDLVVIAGRADEETIGLGKRHLKEGGTLILAADNRYGFKVWSGMPAGEGAATKEFLGQMLPAARIYYPMPDYRTATEIWSDARVPGPGELRGMLPIYDFPKYVFGDPGAMLESAAADGKFGDFAGSFLAIWKKPGAPAAPEKMAAGTSEVIYVKYNRTRKDAFQTRTEIREDEGGKRTVRKCALTPEGRDHIRSLADKYKALAGEHESLSFVRPEVAEDGSFAAFPFLTGKTLTEELGEKLGEEERKEAFARIRAALGTVFGVKKEAVRPFEVTDAFREVFGDGAEILVDDAFAVSNVDALFDNMMVTGDGVTALDYEWAFDFPVPAGFLRWRTLTAFYRRFRDALPGMTEREFLQEFADCVGLPAAGAEAADAKTGAEEVLSLYASMEARFQEYVHGENHRLYLEDYFVKTRTVRELAADAGELPRVKERNEQLLAGIKHRDAELRKLREVHRLTQNHVTNLEVMIADLRRENGEIAKSLQYFARHEAPVFKVRRKMGEVFNKAYPKGTPKRKKLTYAKDAILHPGKSLRLYRTPEGKNLIKGDFEIGEEYRTYGKLRFPRYKKPLVSIIIPCYNQIHYTYLCLQSILENTKDVNYEVVIADDMSTDATEHISEFAENLVVCRGTENLGFLRNCNNAAKKARGKYIMFLNNDTKVTPGWLSSLVNLIGSDPTIGMVGSKLVYPDGRLQEAGGIIWSDGSGWNYGRLDDPDKAEYNYVKDVDYISGAAILLSRALWEEIGGFDERYAPAYCEDSDLAFEVRKHGYRVVYQPLSKVVHYEGISNGTDVNGTGLKRYQVENSEKLKEKWKEELKLQCENTGNPNPFRARERSMGKKILLVIDHYVPTYDRDAGSRTTFQYLKMFLKQGFQVKFLGDNFMHEEPYTTTLTQMGIEVLYGRDYEAGIWDWLDKNGGEIFAAYLNRPHIAVKYVDYIKEHTKMRQIFYGHDLHFLRLFREYELSGDVAARQESDYWKSVEFNLMHKVDISYYPSQVEIDAIHAEDDAIRAKAITAYVYDEFLTDIPEDFAKREGLLFVGGFAHPPNKDAVLWFIKEVWPEIRSRKKMNFYIVGSKAPEEITKLHDPANGIVVKGFVSDEELSELYRTCRIVIVPLRYGAGVKGKVVEALYNGAPIITTSVGSEGIPDVENVLRVEDRPEAFASAVVSLYDDTAALAEMSRRTQDYIRKYFSTEAAWEVIREDFE